MAYLLPVIIMIFGLAADAIVEVAAEISSDSLLDADAGVDAPVTVPVVMDGLIDMRPEASIIAVASVDE
jgi:hypothetical protein